MTGSRFLQPEPSRATEQVATQAPGQTFVSRFVALAATPAAAVSRFVSTQAARHPACARRLAFVVSRVPIVSKFLSFLVPEALTYAPPKPVEIKLEADAMTTPALRPRFNRPSGPRL